MLTPPLDTARSSLAVICCGIETMLVRACFLFSVSLSNHFQKFFFVFCNHNNLKLYLRRVPLVHLCEWPVLGLWRSLSLPHQFRFLQLGTFLDEHSTLVVNDIHAEGHDHDVQLCFQFQTPGAYWHAEKLIMVSKQWKLGTVLCNKTASLRL